LSWRGGKNRPLLLSFRWAWRGLVDTYRCERNFRVHVLVTYLAVLAARWAGFTPTATAIVVLVSALVLAAEAFNTAVEDLVDEMTRDSHPGARRVKDGAAGAVLIASLAAAAIGAVLFLPVLPLLLRILLSLWSARPLLLALELGIAGLLAVPCFIHFPDHPDR